MAEGYSSWVVRAWSRDERGTVRLTIEEVRSGRLVEVRGERAAGIEGVISAAFVEGPDTGIREAGCFDLVASGGIVDRAGEGPGPMRGNERRPEPDLQ